MRAMSTPTRPALGQLPSEPVGWKLRRAREAADKTLEDLAEHISKVREVSQSTLSRLERKQTLDTPKDQQLAVMVLYACGIDPKEVDLNPPEVMPAYVDLDALLGLLIEWSGCIRELAA